MRIGVTSIFSFRPHVEHLAYLAGLLSAAGHEIHGLTCDAALSHCYSRLLRQRGKLRECPRCIVGGIRTFPIGRVTSLSARLRARLDSQRMWKLLVSSVAVRYRTEPIDYLRTSEFQKAIRELEKPLEIAYANAMHWIERNRLEGVVLFNGRMDVLAGIVAACEDLDIPYVSMERPWFAHGIAMFPNGNCLDLHALDKMSVAFAKRPLLKEQARHAGSLSARHFLGQNRLLWRVYNPHAKRTSWPLSDLRERFLILPSSRNEFEGHPDWVCEWGDFTTALDHLLDHLEIDSSQCVLRCHPNWAEKIGRFTGWRSEQHYTEWCNRRGIHVIPSASRESTYDLIAAADSVIVNGSSTGPEAALLGKRVILLGHATYQQAGLCSSITTPAELNAFSLVAKHSPEDTAAKALRYIYMMACRFPCFVPFVRATSNARCEYLVGADPERITQMLRTGEVLPDDGSAANDERHEKEVVSALLNGDWRTFEPPPASDSVAAPRIIVGRRPGFGWIDDLRDRLPRGDA